MAETGKDVDMIKRACHTDEENAITTGRGVPPHFNDFDVKFEDDCVTFEYIARDRKQLFSICVTEDYPDNSILSVWDDGDDVTVDTTHYNQPLAVIFSTLAKGLCKEVEITTKQSDIIRTSLCPMSVQSDKLAEGPCDARSSSPEEVSFDCSTDSADEISDFAEEDDDYYDLRDPLSCSDSQMIHPQLAEDIQNVIDHFGQQTISYGSDSSLDSCDVLLFLTSTSLLQEDVASAWLLDKTSPIIINVQFSLSRYRDAAPPHVDLSQPNSTVKTRVICQLENSGDNMAILIDMGFSATVAKHALGATNGDLMEASNYLINSFEYELLPRQDSPPLAENLLFSTYPPWCSAPDLSTCPPVDPVMDSATYAPLDPVMDSSTCALRDTVMASSICDPRYGVMDSATCPPLDPVMDSFTCAPRDPLMDSSTCALRDHVMDSSIYPPLDPVVNSSKGCFDIWCYAADSVVEPILEDNAVNIAVPKVNHESQHSYISEQNKFTTAARCKQSKLFNFCRQSPTLQDATLPLSCSVAYFPHPVRPHHSSLHLVSLLPPPFSILPAPSSSIPPSPALALPRTGPLLTPCPPLTRLTPSAAESVSLASRGFLVQMLEYCSVRLSTINEYCIVCDERHKSDCMLTPSVCSKQLCIYGFEQLGLMSNAFNDISTTPEVIDLLVSMLYAAIRTGRRDLVIDPFPTIIDPTNPSQLALSPKNKDYTLLQNTVAKMLDVGGLSTLRGSELKATLDKTDPLCYPLLQWITSSNRSHIIKLPAANVIKFMRTPHQFLLRTSPPSKDRIFLEARDTFGSVFAFHGSTMDNWHSILRRGLLSASNTAFQRNGALYGAGIYLSPSNSVSFAYSMILGAGIKLNTIQKNKSTLMEVNDFWGLSDCNVGPTFLRSRDIRCIALCEVITSPDLEKHGDIWVMRNEDHVCTRFLFVYENGGKPCEVINTQSPEIIDQIRAAINM